MKIYAIIVMYNTKLVESETYKSIKSNKDIQIIICDNSTRYLENDKFCEQKVNLKYINMNGNVGLPKAYNMAIKEIPKDDNSLVCIFDDDTTVPSNYFEKIIAKSENSDSDIYLPLVYSNETLISPNIVNGGIAMSCDNIPEVIEKNTSAINSGMAIRTRVFIKNQYDEKMFLDYVDHKFIFDVKKNNCTFEVIKEIVIKQNFSSDSDDIALAKSRYKLYKNDVKIFIKVIFLTT